MLKLLKYELIGSYRQYFITFVLYLVLCFMTVFLPNAIAQFTSGLLVVAFFGISISIFVNIVLYFNKSMYTRSGYLTLTLPVSTHQLILSKLIGAIIWTILACFILFVGISGMVLLSSQLSISLSDWFSIIQHIFKDIATHFTVFAKGILQLLLSLSSAILSLYLTVTFVHTKFVRKYKTAVGIAGYVFVFWLLSFVLANFTDQSFLWSLTANQAFWMNCVFEGILALLFYFGTVYLIDHFIEVE